MDGNSIKNLAHELRTAGIYNFCFAKFCVSWKMLGFLTENSAWFVLLLDKFADCEKLLLFILLIFFPCTCVCLIKWSNPRNKKKKINFPIFQVKTLYFRNIFHKNKNQENEEFSVQAEQSSLTQRCSSKVILTSFLQ